MLDLHQKVKQGFSLSRKLKVLAFSGELQFYDESHKVKSREMWDLYNFNFVVRTILLWCKEKKLKSKTSLFFLHCRCDILIVDL